MSVGEGSGDVLFDAGKKVLRVRLGVFEELFVVAGVVEFPVVGLASDDDEVFVVGLFELIILMDLA